MPPTVDVLHLPGDVAERLRAAATASYPAEACGFLLGAVAGGVGHVRAARAEENRAARNDRFLIDAADVFAAMRAARAAGDELIGVYHSHPDGDADPSATDRMDAWGDWLHVIVACRRGDAGAIKCWRDDGERFASVEIVGGEA